MNAIEFLKSQHEKAKAGFQKIEQGDAKARRRLWSALSPELKLHEQMEEQQLYDPISQDTDDEVLASWPERHMSEIQEAQVLIATLDEQGAEAAEWLQTLKRLHAVLEGHIREEEREIFPKIKKTWSADRLEEAGSRMLAMKPAKKKAAA